MVKYKSGGKLDSAYYRSLASYLPVDSRFLEYNFDEVGEYYCRTTPDFNQCLDNFREDAGIFAGQGN